VAGDIPKEDHLTTVGQGDKVEIIPSKAPRHTIFDVYATPAAARRSLGEKKLLNLAGQVDIGFAVSAGSHGKGLANRSMIIMIKNTRNKLASVFHREAESRLKLVAFARQMSAYSF
jgi:hypothetical protein